MKTVTGGYVSGETLKSLSPGVTQPGQRNILDHLASIAFSMTRSEARDRRCCIRCEDQIDDDWTTLDLKEWEISLVCGACFDAVTEDEA